MTTKIITLSLPSELLKAVDRYCKKTSRNRSELARELFRERLDEARQMKIMK